MEQTRLLPATICSWASAVALAVALGALSLHFFASLDTPALLITVATATAIAAITGIACAWLYRLARPVSTLATIGFAITGGMLVTGAVAELLDYAAGGYNNIGATLLLMLGGFAGILATGGSAALAVTCTRQLLKARFPQP